MENYQPQERLNRTGGRLPQPGNIQATAQSIRNNSQSVSRLCGREIHPLPTLLCQIPQGILRTCNPLGDLTISSSHGFKPWDFTLIDKGYDSQSVYPRPAW